MKIQYIDKKFRGKSLMMIEKAEQIIQEYQAQGLQLTLRQLYYQFVSRDLLANKQSEYKRLGSVINNARLAGLIDWNAIEDRTRFLRGLTTHDNPSSILYSAARSFKTDLWENQDNYVEVWIEKDALVGVIDRICTELRIDFFACRGYTSQSEQYNAANRLKNRLRDGKKVTVLHFGDHDPSGIDMTRDNEDRLRMFISHNMDDSNFNIERMALNMDQVRKYNPPPNPAKLTDSRCKGYVALHGNKSWELDALDPKVISALIRDSVEPLIDREQWDSDIEIEDGYIDRLNKVAMDFEE